MPRLPRIFSKTCFYHVIVQGINKEAIFSKKVFIQDYQNFILSKLPNSNINILAYCIMNNHAHFLIFCEQISDLSKFMHRLNTSFSRHYNKLNQRVGFVFRDRFLSQPITSPKHLINCLVYIHNNPVKANIVSSPEKYKFSSYNEFIGKKIIISDESVKLLFKNDENYINKFIFLHKKLKINNEDFYDIKERKISDLISEFKNNYKISIKDLNKNKFILSLFIKEARKQTNATLTEIANVLEISKSSVAKYLKD